MQIDITPAREYSLKVNGFDFDGVVSIGIHPGPMDVVITGRCVDEARYVNETLRFRGIMNAVYFNPTDYATRGDHTIRSRKISGMHKARTIKRLESGGVLVEKFFEDDPIQATIIEDACPFTTVVMIKHDLVQK